MRGYTLIEMIIYIAILALISALVINSLAIMIGSFGEARMLSKINSSAETAMERMSREIRSAYDVDQVASVLNSHPGDLTINIQPDPLETARFYLESGMLKVSENGATGEPLTSSGLTVSNLIFRLITSGTVSKAVKIEMEIQGTRGNRQFSEKFYNTIILRGSY